MLACFARNACQSALIIRSLPEQFEQRSSTDGRSCLVYKKRVSSVYEETVATGGFQPIMILGDHRERKPGDEQPLGNATTITCHLDHGLLEALTAIPGLPPLYLTETPNHVVLTSDLFLLKCVTGLGLRFDPEGVRDLVRIGRPVAHRTMFRGVHLVPGGMRVTVSTRNGVSVQSAWEPPEPSPCRTWDEYTELQTEAFGRAAASLDCKDTVLSLTAGLDSRAIFAALIANTTTVTALTVTGEAESLDARVATRLCHAYGMTHRRITLDATFWRDLPDLANRASLLCGGIGSVSRSAQVYCYRQLGPHAPGNMLSGYLGNQVGRLGNEGLTPQRADAALLSHEFMSELGSSVQADNWWTAAMRRDGHLDPRFLLQQESMFGSLASYAIGNSYSVQQTPYSSRILIDNLWRMPTSDSEERGTAGFHELRHRFLGVPLNRSFQRRYINQVGGFVAEYPINWGWRSEGGTSVPGLFWGGLTCVDAFLSTRVAWRPAITLLRGFGISGLHEWKPERQWRRQGLKDFAYDMLTSRKAVDSGLFDIAFLRQRLDRQFSNPGMTYDATLLSALDLALAAKNFEAGV